MEQKNFKRRLVSRDSYENHKQQNNPLMFNKSTYTDFHKPMLLNAWTQTPIDETSNALSENKTLSIIEKLEDRIRKLENLFASHSINANAQANSMSNCNQIDKRKIELSNNQNKKSQIKYKIIASGGMEFIEPIEVDYDDDDDENNTNYVDDDPNNSDDSTRLEICLPKEESNNDNDKSLTDSQEATEQKEFVNEQHQEQQQPPYQQQVIYKTEAVPQKLYHVSSTQNRNSIISVVPPTNISPSPLSTPKIDSTPLPLTQQSMSQPLEAKNQNITEMEKKYGSSSTLNEISSSISNKQLEHNLIPASSHGFVTLGPNNTKIPIHIYDSIDWNSSTAATRKLLITIFDRETLSTHTMTGKPSPAFKGRDLPSKRQLNPSIVGDIIYTVSRKCGVPEKDVRNAITTKCADENKMSKQREKKRKSLSILNKENLKNVHANQPL